MWFMWLLAGAVLSAPLWILVGGILGYWYLTIKVVAKTAEEG